MEVGFPSYVLGPNCSNKIYSWGTVHLKMVKICPG